MLCDVDVDIAARTSLVSPFRGVPIASSACAEHIYPFTAGWAHMCAQTFHTTGASERIAVEQHCKHVCIEGPQHSRMISCKASANAEMDTAHGANILGGN